MVAHIFTVLLAPFASKKVNYLRQSEPLKMLEHRQIVVFGGKCCWFRILANVPRLTAPWIMDQFEHKRCQKKREIVSYQLLHFFSKTICYTLTTGRQILGHYIYVELCRFIFLRVSVPWKMPEMIYCWIVISWNQ